MASAKELTTPLSSSESLKLDNWSPSIDPTLYRQTISALQYLSLTRSNISFVVNCLSQFMHCPTLFHWTAVKRVLQYLKHTLLHGYLFVITPLPLCMHSQTQNGLGTRMIGPQYLLPLSSFAPILLVGVQKNKKRLLDYQQTLNTCQLHPLLLNWIGYKTYFKSFNFHLLCLQSIIYCDNINATYLCANPMFHSRMKHIAIDFHYIRD